MPGTPIGGTPTGGAPATGGGNPFPPPLGPELDRIVARYPQRAAAMLPVLTRLQAERGHIADATVDEVARYLGVAAAHVHGVVSFYSMYDRHPVGRRKIYVCRTLSCRLRGAPAVIEALEVSLGAKAGAITADGEFTIVPFECLGLCEMAPCMLVGDRRWGRLDEPGAIARAVGEMR